MIEVDLIVIGISISKAELIKWNNVAAGKFCIIANDISVWNGSNLLLAFVLSADFESHIIDFDI